MIDMPRSSADLGPVQPVLPELITKDELNLAEYPFALLSDRAPKAMKALAFADTITDIDGKKVERRWIVNGSEAYGLPTASDEPVYLALMQMGREQGFQSSVIHFVFGDLLKRLGLSDDGRSYKRVRSSLLRLTGVQITADRSFFDKAKGRYSTKSFHIFDSFEINGGPGVREASFVRFSEELFGSIQAGALNTLNFGLYLSLNSSVARRLYRYLDKATFDGKETYRIGIHKLAFERLGMARSYFPSQIKRLLDPAHEELIQAGFLKAVSYQKGREDELVVYRFSQPNSEQGQLTEALIERGVTAAAARKLVSEHGCDRVRRHIAAFDALRAAGSLRAKNPGGWLRSAIDNDYDHPEAKPLSKPTVVVAAHSEPEEISDEDFDRMCAALGDETVQRIKHEVTEDVLSRPIFRSSGSRKGVALVVESHFRRAVAESFRNQEEGAGPVVC